MSPKRRNRAAIAILAAGICICTAGIIAAEGALHPHRRLLGLADVAAARSIGAALSECRLRAADGAELRAWLLLPDKSNGRAVALFHGVADARAGMVGHATMFLAHGYAVLMPDSRAHGESGGAFATYGLLEACDVNQWAAWLRRQTQAQCVFGLGESMGAGILIQALGHRDSPFCAAVAESPFSSFREVAYLRVGQQVGAGEPAGRWIFRPIVDAGLLWTRLRYGVNLQLASPAEAMRRIRTPLLIIHGAKDDNIPMEHARRLARRSSGDVEYWEVAEAGHTDAIVRAGAAYSERVLGWFNHHDAPPQAPSGLQ